VTFAQLGWAYPIGTFLKRRRLGLVVSIRVSSSLVCQLKPVVSGMNVNSNEAFVCICMYRHIQTYPTIHDMYGLQHIGNLSTCVNPEVLISYDRQNTPSRSQQ